MRGTSLLRAPLLVSPIKPHPQQALARATHPSLGKALLLLSLKRPLAACQCKVSANEPTTWEMPTNIAILLCQLMIYHRCESISLYERFMNNQFLRKLSFSRSSRTIDPLARLRNNKSLAQQREIPSKLDLRALKANFKEST
jgi:hypothetical protein